MEEVAQLPAWTRGQLGLPLIIPEADYSGLQLFVDNYLPRLRGLRHIFGLDQTVDLAPPFRFDEPDMGRNYSWYNAQTQFELNRRSVYGLVEEMDSYDICSSALDIYAEEATQTDADTGRVAWVECEAEEAKRELMALFDAIQLEDRAFGIVRSMCKYGDDFEQIIASGTRGIINLDFIQPQRLTRIEDRVGRLMGFSPGLLNDYEIRDPEQQKKLKLSRPWDFLHFRLQSSRRELRHGETVLLAARRSWRQLKILEDTLVLYRMNRATDKDVYYIDTGNQTPDQQWQTVHRFRRELRKKFYVNTVNGQMRQQYDPRTADEDMYIPIPRDSKTRVERLQGSGPQGDIYDVDHFRNKLFAALKIPKAFMGYEKDVNAKSTLVSQDIRFARSIYRVQRAFKHGLTQLCRIHLALRGYDVDKVRFRVRMAPINYLDDLARADIYAQKYDVAAKLLELPQMGQQTDPKTGGVVPNSGIVANAPAWRGWVLRRFLGLTDEELDLFLGQGSADASRTVSNRTLQAFSERSAVRARLSDDTVHVFDPLPPPKVGEKTEEEKSLAEAECFDLEREETDLARLLGNVTEDGRVLCTACREQTMVEHQSEEEPYLLCPKCGFVAFLEPACGTESS